MKRAWWGESALPPVDEATVRAYADPLWALAAKYRISDLRFASAGRLVGHISEGRDAFDRLDFEIEAIELLGAEVHLFPDKVLRNQNVSPDLLEATPL